MFVPIEYLKFGDKIKVLAVAGMHEDEVAELPRGTYYGRGVEPGTIRVRYALDGSSSFIEATSWMLVGLVGEEDTDPITDIGVQVLQRQIATLDSRLEETKRDNNHLLRATGIIEDKLHGYGRDYDRIDEVNDLIADINKQIIAECDTVPLIDKINTEFKVHVSGTLTIAFDSVLTVLAADEEDAQDKVEENPEDYLPFDDQDKLLQLIRKSMDNYYDIEVADDLKVTDVQEA